MANTTTALNEAVPGLRQNAWNMAAGAGLDLAMGPLTPEQYNRLKPQRPQSQYDERKVPTELDGIRHALGQHDWSEYVALVERLVSQEIDEKQFETSGRRIFYVIDARIRAKMEAMILAWVRQVKEMEKDMA
ncbi:hypothetical protein SLS59_004634 [Nothophoma quercina]|uniref:Uncharacterized protein n=1 Tax=Nothophoma quercina TaxID=749835 RepID=A0ABR3REW3_9PLEO